MARLLAIISLIISTVPLTAADKPNVIMILCDDVGFECFSAYGSREYSTPRLRCIGGWRDSIRKLSLDAFVYAESRQSDVR